MVDCINIEVNYQSAKIYLYFNGIYDFPKFLNLKGIDWNQLKLNHDYYGVQEIFLEDREDILCLIEIVECLKKKSKSAYSAYDEEKFDRIITACNDWLSWPEREKNK